MWYIKLLFVHTIVLIALLYSKYIYYVGLPLRKTIEKQVTTYEIPD